jgi:hypothetical protein
MYSTIYTCKAFILCSKGDYTASFVGDNQFALISDDPHVRIFDAETDLALSRLSREDREMPLLAVTIN